MGELLHAACSVHPWKEVEMCARPGVLRALLRTCSDREWLHLDDAGLTPLCRLIQDVGKVTYPVAYIPAADANNAACALMLARLPGSLEAVNAWNDCEMSSAMTALLRGESPRMFGALVREGVRYHGLTLTQEKELRLDGNVRRHMMKKDGGRELYRRALLGGMGHEAVGPYEKWATLAVRDQLTDDAFRRRVTSAAFDVISDDTLPTESRRPVLDLLLKASQGGPTALT